MQALMDDGTVEFFNLTNAAEAGAMPDERLASAGPAQGFSEVTFGVTRQYLAKGVDEQVDMVIQIWPEAVRPKIGQIAVLTDYEYQEDDDGDQFRIDDARKIQEDELEFFQLTLRRLEGNYAISGE